MKVNEVTPPTPQLNDATFAQLKGPIMRCWQVIAPDLYQLYDESGDDEDCLTNDGAIEACIDADRLRMYGGEQHASLRQGSPDGNAADELIKALCAAHGYSTVLKWLSTKIHLA